MADTPIADDQFERYYIEKLWAWIPSLYRHEDGIAERPGTLRALVELIGEQVAVLRRSHDRLWDDAFIDLCDDWAVPYLGDLVGTRLVSALNRRARRVDVAKTIYYRRRKGTPRVLEELIADITGWDGKVVESFRGLARAVHHLDPPLAERLEPARGWADLRHPRLAERAGGPWDGFAHTPDLRRPRGHDGRWNIPRVSFHLFRLAAYRITDVIPHVRADGVTFTFDPSGRDTQLFMPRHRDATYAWDDWRSAQPWEVPAPMACRVLGHAEYVIDAAVVAAMAAHGTAAAAVAELAAAIGARFVTEDALHDFLAVAVNAATLLAPGNYDELRAVALIDDCGKRALWGDAVDVRTPAAIARARVSAANLAGFTATAAFVDLLVDPVRGRGKLLAAPADPDDVRVAYAYGLGGAIGAGTYDRRATVIDAPERVVVAATGAAGTIVAADFPTDLATGNLVGATELPDSGTYDVTADAVDVERLIVQAANFTRPYLRLAGDWTLTAAAGLEATLALDGLWLGARAPAAIVLAGAWSRVELRGVTLDPGGVDVDGATLHPVTIRVEGQIDLLVIDHSIVAAVATVGAGVIDTIVVTDAIVDAQRVAGGTAIALTPGTVTLARVTVLGAVDVERLEATEALITGLVDVTDTQAGCFRFSAAPAGSRLPHPFRATTWDGGPVFSSLRFGDPGYAWLAESAPDAVRRGAENGSELGAWSASLNPIKEDSLARKVEEYLPFGLAPMFIRET
ncbi:MAG: hypothetical protein IPL61_34160 [Myxococcales bacterium]|nr:hypothetical protein [Myxococcales bacterium]